MVFTHNQNCWTIEYFFVACGRNSIERLLRRSVQRYSIGELSIKSAIDHRYRSTDIALVGLY